MNLLDGEFTAITFSELKHLSDADLPQCVSKNAALRICKHNSLAVRETTGNEIFNLWVHKLVKVFEGVTFTSAEWQMITDFFLEIVQQLTSSDINEVIQDELTSIVCDCMELLKWFQPLVIDLDTTICCIVLGFALQTILKCFEFFKKCDLKAVNNKLPQDAIILHNFVLQILNQSVILSNVTDVNEFFKLTELIEKLCICCEQCTSMGIKTVLETWKCVTKLTVNCAKFTNLVNQDHTTIPSSWATRPFQFLINEIGRNLTTVLREEIEEIEKYLRVTNFYLKLLQRLTSHFQHEKFPCADTFLKMFTCYTSQKFLSHKSAETKAVFDKYVKHELSEIFRMIFKNKHFIRAIHNEELLKKSNTFICISDEFLNVVITDRDIDFIDHNVDMFIQNLLHLIKDAYNFCNNEIYNKIIEQYAALAILNSNHKLKNFFKLSVNNHSLLLVQTSVDILLVISRSSFTSHTEHLQEFRWWRHCNEKFSILTTNPIELHVQKLLINYFDLCQSSKEIADVEPIQLHKNNYRFLLAIASQRHWAQNDMLLAIATDITNELFNLFKKWKTNSNVEDYYTMTIYIKVLSTCHLPPQPMLLENIKDFMLSLFTKPINELQHFCKFIEIVLDYMLTYNELLKDEVFLQLIQTLTEHVCNLSSEILNLFYCLLNVALENVNLKETAQNLLSKLSNNPKTKLTNFFYITKSRNEYQNCQINLDLWKDIKLLPMPKHKCAEGTISFETKYGKRLRIENDTDAKFVLKNMLNESEQLIKLTTDIDDAKTINIIVNNLQHVMSKNTTENASFLK